METGAELVSSCAAPAIGLNLVTCSLEQLLAERADWIGRQVQPRHCADIPATAQLGIRWSADNGCFSGFDELRYRAMLARCAGWPGCVFVVVPDRVADHRGTLRLWRRWQPIVTDVTGGQPLAFVAQNGATPANVPWDELEALFLGGDTAWKLGHAALELAVAAKDRGKWLHVGRVNSARRLRYALAIGADSFDGTKWSRWSRAHRPTADRVQTQPVQTTLASMGVGSSR